MTVESFKEESMVKFISYTGKYPNLCSGILTVNIDGQKLTFGSYGKDTIFPKIWCSGGSVRFDKNCNAYVTKGAWECLYCSSDINKFPPIVSNNIEDIIKVMNENVPHGCCEGCI
jgi:hypothetical protein